MRRKVRLVCHMSPVGPRQMTGVQWFALQVSAALDLAPEDGDFNHVAVQLLPWTFVPKPSQVRLAYRDPAGTIVVHPDPLPIVEPTHAVMNEVQRLQGEIVETFITTAELRRRLTLVWNAPAPDDNNPNAFGDPTASLAPSTVELSLYLATLPAQVARALRTSLFVKVDLAALSMAEDQPDLIAAPDFSFVEPDGTPTVWEPVTDVMAPGFPTVPTDDAEAHWGLHLKSGVNSYVEEVGAVLKPVRPPHLDDTIALDLGSLWIKGIEPSSRDSLRDLDQRLDRALDSTGVVLGLKGALNLGSDAPSLGPARTESLPQRIWNGLALALIMEDMHPAPPPPPGDIVDPLLQHYADERHRLADAQVALQIARVLAAIGQAQHAAAVKTAFHDYFNNPPGRSFPHGDWRAICIKAVGGDQSLSDRELVLRLREAQPIEAVQKSTEDRRLPPFAARLQLALWVHILERAVSEPVRDVAKAINAGGAGLFAPGEVTFARQQHLRRVRQVMQEADRRTSDGTQFHEALRKTLEDEIGLGLQAVAAPLFRADRSPEGLVELIRQSVPIFKDMGDGYDTAFVADSVRLSAKIWTSGKAGEAVAGHVGDFLWLSDRAIEQPIALCPGIAFTYGKPRALQDQQDRSSDPLRHISGTGLLIKRQSPNGNAGTWRLVTAGDIVGPIKAASDRDLLCTQAITIPHRATYNHLTLRPEFQYEGRIIGIDDPIAQDFPTIGEDKNAGNDADFLGIDLVGYHAHPVVDPASRLLAPVLRYGDNYRAAIFGISVAGGLPRELSDPDDPSLLDPTRPIDPPADAVSKPFEFRRRVPVGEITLYPPAAPGKPVDINAPIFANAVDRQPWPEVPRGVRLLTHEMQAHQFGQTASRREAGATLLVSALATSRLVRKTVTFEIAPPLCGVQVLRRWLMPQVGQPQDRKMIDEALRLDNVVRKSFDDPSRPYRSLDPMFQDPVVRHVGVRLFVFDPATRRFTEQREHRQTLDAAPDSTAGQARYLQVTVSADVGGPARTVTLTAPNTRSIDVKLGAGAGAFIELHPLVAQADLDQRFTASCVARMMEDLRPDDLADPAWGPIGGVSHVILPGTKVDLEAVSDELPDLDQVYGAFTASIEGVTTRLLFNAAEPDPCLDFIGAADLLRQHWTWRGLPLAVRQDTAGGGGRWLTDEFGRPPPEFADAAALRDLENLGLRPDSRRTPQWRRLSDWEAVLSLDHAFATRKLQSFEWSAGAINSAATLVQIAVDQRRDRVGGDYHRYTLRLRSRYALLIAPEKREVTLPYWRRTLHEYHGGALRPPVVLAVLPLMRGMDMAVLPSQPAESLREAAPVLLICDHVAYGPYGFGDRLTARIVPDIVDGELPEPPTTPVEEGKGDTEDATGGRPYRVGPVPDVYGRRDSANPYWGTPDTRSDALVVWGPFGTTFETIDDEPRIAATAYVVHPPEGAGPHWLAEVVFDRAIFGYAEGTEVDAVSASVETRLYAERPGYRSDSVSRRQLYFMPLVRPVNDEAALPVLGTLDTRSGASFGTLIIDANRLPALSPATRLADQSFDQPIRSHRYLVMVARLVTDSMSGDLVPVPVALYALKAEEGLVVTARRFDGDHLPPSFMDDEPPDIVAYVLEVRTGRRTDAPWLFDDPKTRTMADFWRSLLPDKAGDRGWDTREFLDLPEAHGMIEAVQGPFWIKTAR
jgi:hypothetical protein